MMPAQLPALLLAVVSFLHAALLQYAEEYDDGLQPVHIHNSHTTHDRNGSSRNATRQLLLLLQSAVTGSDSRTPAVEAADDQDYLDDSSSSSSSTAPGLSFSGGVQLVSFCVFEILIGMFWPSMMTLRAKYVPEEQRSTIINTFRIPLNLFVCIILWKVRRCC